jgi:hypothetical protein
MDGLNSLLIKLDIRPLPLQVHEPQGPQNFHLFSQLPPEIRKKIWKLSFPDGRWIRVHPIVPKDVHLSLLVRGNKPQRLLIEFSYEDNDPIVALKTSRESRMIALSVYRSFVKGGKRVYFCSDSDTLLFAELVEVSLMLLRTRMRPGLVKQLLANTFDHEAVQLTGQLSDSSTIKWSWILEDTTLLLAATAKIGSIPSEFLKQPLTSHYKVRFNVRNAFFKRYGPPYYRRGVRGRKRSGKVRGI